MSAACNELDMVVALTEVGEFSDGLRLFRSQLASRWFNLEACQLYQCLGDALSILRAI